MKEFDRVFMHYDRFISFFNLNKMHEIKKVLNLKGNEIIADFGGGTGRLAEFLSPSCKSIYVVDESSGMLSRVRTLQNIIPIKDDILNTSLEDNSIDVVILSDVLHHIKNQTRLINEIFRVLNNDGKLVILDFEKKHIKTKLLRSFEFFLFGHLLFKTKVEVLKLLENRFTIKEIIDGKYYFIIRGDKNA